MKNVLEDLVAREYERLKPSVADFCGCDLCRDDVLVYALNHLPPHYVSQLKGEILTSVAMGADQSRADIAVALLDGLRRVQKNPREGHPER